jgi:hypothetical protein
MVMADGRTLVNPEEYLSPTAQPVSIRPAMRRVAHAVAVISWR